MTLLNFSTAPHGGDHRLLPEWQSQPRIEPVLIIDHSIVGSASGAWFFFRDRTNLEAHLIVKSNGYIWQCMDTDRQADANLDANDKAISIETEDDGDPNNTPWTGAQLNSLVWLHEKLHRIYPAIQRREATDCNGPGLGYHSKMGAPSCWTPSAGKTCPGKPVRVAQWRATLLPSFLHPDQEDDVSQAEVEAGIRAVFKLGPNETFDVPFGQLNNRKIFAMLAERTSTLVNSANAAIAAVNAVKTQVNDSEDAVLAALAALDLDLSDEDIAAIAAEVDIDETAVAEAVRFRLHDALAS